MRRLLLVPFVALASCKSASKPEVEITVHAASSLKEAFTEIERGFESANPGVSVSLNLAGSPELRTQIEHGAPADVIASADVKHMAALVEEKLAGPSTLFTCNEPVVVTPAGEAKPATFADLAGTDRLVFGTPELPIGAYTERILEAASKDSPGFREKVEANVVSRELNVRQVLAKVTLGEANAAFVYRTDALSAGDSVRVIDVPAAYNVQAEYPIAALTGSRHPEEAAAFVAFVLSSAGQASFTRRGFRPCEAR